MARHDEAGGSTSPGPKTGRYNFQSLRFDNDRSGMEFVTRHELAGVFASILFRSRIVCNDDTVSPGILGLVQCTVGTRQ